MNILITICGRGGSRGIPGKNIRPLNGIPLIAYTIQTARQFSKQFPAHLSLSTDSDEIAEVAAHYGLETQYRRPGVFATDKAGKIGAIVDLMSFEEKRFGKKYDYILDMDITAPLRTVEDLAGAFQRLLDNPEAINIFSVSPARRNPYFNMVEQQGDFVRLVKDFGSIKSRQAAPIVYDMNASFYFYRRQFFEEEWPTAITDRSLHYLVPHTCFDLDEPIDFQIMEYLMREDLLEFNL